MAEDKAGNVTTRMVGVMAAVTSTADLGLAGTALTDLMKAAELLIRMAEIEWGARSPSALHSWLIS